MTRVYTRRPEWSVTIRRPDYTKSTLSFLNVAEWSRVGNQIDRVEFVSSKEKENGTTAFTDLIGYEYENSLADPGNPFSLTIVPQQDANGLTWKDKIKAKDLVYISEFGKVRYIGLVKQSSYSFALNNELPARSISISGESIGGMLKSFNLPMNIYLWYNLGTTAQTENDKLAQALTSNLEEDQDLGDVFDLIKDAFFSVAFGASSTGFLAVLNEYFALSTSALTARYPLNIKPFQQESNTLWSIFRTILPMPVYEIYGLFIDNKYTMVSRETPFDKADWDNLKRTTIDPLFLKEHNFSDSDSEVYTHYYSTMPNSAFSQNEIYADSALNEISIFDDEKLPTYGYNQLEATFPFFNLDKGKEYKSRAFLKANSARLYAWYRNNVEFQSGEITLMTVPDENNEYINIGERIQYLQGSGNSIEFYVEKVKRKMTYPETMTSAFSVTRGYEYGSKTVIVGDITIETPQVQKISKMGRKLIQSERDALGGSGD